jgi:hypothetical protein
MVDFGDGWVFEGVGFSLMSFIGVEFNREEFALYASSL